MAKRHRLIPAYSHSRMIQDLKGFPVVLRPKHLVVVSPLPTGLGPIVSLRITVRLHKGLVLAHGNRIAAEAVWSGDQRALKTRRFIAVPRLGLVIAHRKGPRGNLNPVNVR